MMFCMPPSCKEIRLIPDFYWSGVKLSIWTRPFFCHHLWLDVQMGMRAHLDIYVSIAFQWYKGIFNPMGFDPCNRPLKIRESIETPTPKMGVHLGVWVFIHSHSFALLRAWDWVTPKLPSWPAILQALALVTSLRLGLWHLVNTR
jgi:hypothetical protein